MYLLRDTSIFPSGLNQGMRICCFFAKSSKLRVGNIFFKCIFRIFFLLWYCKRNGHFIEYIYIYIYMYWEIDQILEIIVCENVCMYMFVWLFKSCFYIHKICFLYSIYVSLYLYLSLFLSLSIYIYIYIRGAFNKFPDVFLYRYL